jgi:hypothetical protein
MVSGHMVVCFLLPGRTRLRYIDILYFDVKIWTFVDHHTRFARFGNVVRLNFGVRHVVEM